MLYPSLKVGEFFCTFLELIVIFPGGVNPKVLSNESDLPPSGIDVFAVEKDPETTLKGKYSYSLPSINSQGLYIYMCDMLVFSWGI